MDNMEGLNQHKVNKFRSLITQVLAALSSAVIMFNLAEMNALMSVVNSELRRDNGAETFTITKNQASWYSSLHNLMHIAGSLLAGYLQERCGRKGCMLFGVIPQVIGCALLLYSTQPMHLYLSSISIGIGAALGEVPIATYISETASSRLRGRLFFFTKFGYGLGALFMFFLSNYVKWRNLALISAACPLITACYLLMLPETPSWLLSKGRHQDALESLSWLRGWAPTTLVSEEFAKLQQYVRESKNLGKSKNKYLPVATKSETEESNQKNRSWNGFKVLLTDEFLQPYKIVTATFFLSYILSLKAVKPYLIIILERFKVKVNSKNILAISSAAQILGAVTMVLTVNLLGKRKLIFWTFTGSSICIALFGLYSLLHSIYGIEQGWILYVIFITIYYLTGYAIGGMPWYICGEIYPQKIRGMASGISATTGYIMIFALTKTYFDMEKLFEMPNLFFFYAIIGIAGTIYLYYSLPETENKTLEEIEKVFQSRKKSKDELDREFTNRSRNKSSNILRTMICYPVLCFSHSSSKVIATGDANRVTGKSQES